MADLPIPNTNGARSKIAIWLVAFCAIGVTLLSAIVLIGAVKDPGYALGDAVQLVFTAVLPLMGTWVGTVLAYYFSKDNFEAASKSVQDMAKIATDEKLKTLFVRDEMISFDSMTYLQLTAAKPAGQWTIKELQKMLSGKITRIPVLNENRHVLHVIHDSIFFRFIANESERLSAATPPEKFDPDKETLANLLAIAELKRIVTESRAFVSVNATLAAAKNAMDTKPDCLDVFVTQSGAETEPIEGWLTNKRIMKHATTPG